MYRTHSFEETLNLVSQVKSGIPLKQVARKYDLEAKMLHHWVDYYNNQRIKLRLKGKSLAQYRVLIEK